MSWWPPWPTLKPGYEGHPMTSVCLLLRAQAREVRQLVLYADLPPQAEYDGAPKAGIRVLQRAKGLTVDGILGPQTWPHLVVTVERGDRGDAVLAVQHEYAYRDMSSGEGPGLARDGQFGPRTEKWVKGFQQAVELKPDGVVGPKTWRALVSGALAG